MGDPCAPPKAARKLHSRFIRDNLVKSLKFSSFVILAKARIQYFKYVIDSGALPGTRFGVRRSDDVSGFLRSYNMSLPIRGIVRPYVESSICQTTLHSRNSKRS